MMQPLKYVDGGSVSVSASGTFAAIVPQQCEVTDTTTDHCGDFWYQHLEDFAVTETDPDADSGYFDSMLAALVPDNTDTQQDSSDAAATAEVDGHLSMLTTMPLPPATEPFWGPACITPCAAQSDHGVPVPDAAVIATAAPGQASACNPVRQLCMPVWPAGDTAAAAEYHATFDPTAGALPATAVSLPAPAPAAAAADIISAATATGGLTQKLYRTIGDAGSGSSSSSSPAIRKFSTSAAMPPRAAVPAQRSSAPTTSVTKPAASAGVVCDGLTLRREANKYSQRRQRYRRQQDMEQIKVQLSELADKHAATKGKLDSLRAENSALFSRLSNVTAKWQGTVALNASLQQENTTHKVEIASLQQQLAKVQAQLVHQQIQRSQQQQHQQQQQWSQCEVWNSSGVCWQQQSHGQHHWG